MGREMAGGIYLFLFIKIYLYTLATSAFGCFSGGACYLNK
jgi:hypothetical protein